MKVAKVIWEENPETQAIRELRKKVFVQEQGMNTEIIEDKYKKDVFN